MELKKQERVNDINIKAVHYHYFNGNTDSM